MKFNLFVIFKCNHSNIFVNILRKIEEKITIPLLCKSINRFTVSGKSRATKDEILDFVKIIALIVKNLKKENEVLHLVFKNLGIRAKRRKQTHKNAFVFREIVVDVFTDLDLPITTYIDASTIPFNGCKLSKRRHRKRKHLLKDTDE